MESDKEKTRRKHQRMIDFRDNDESFRHVKSHIAALITVAYNFHAVLASIAFYSVNCTFMIYFIVVKHFRKIIPK